MNNSIRRIKVFFQKTIKSIYYTVRICFSGFQGYNSLNMLARKIERKDKLVVFGNGNSLKNFDFKTISESVDSIVVNHHILDDSYMKIKPKYYVLADPYFFFHVDGVKIIETISKKTNWEMFLIIPGNRKEKQAIKKLSLVKNIHLIYLPNKYFEGFKRLEFFFYDKNLAMPKLQNVIVGAIYAGICLNYKRIELYGVEHNWFRFLIVTDTNDICLEDTHFYDKENVQATSFKTIPQFEKMHLSDIVRCYAQMFESYLYLNEFALKKQTKIINKTKNSFIDAFEREY